jgi:hypothetical protein
MGRMCCLRSPTERGVYWDRSGPSESWQARRPDPCGQLSRGGRTRWLAPAITRSVAHEPSRFNRQAPDHGTQCRSSISAASAEQARVARSSIDQFNRANRSGAAGLNSAIVGDSQVSARTRPTLSRSQRGRSCGSVNAARDKEHSSGWDEALQRSRPGARRLPCPPGSTPLSAGARHRDRCDRCGRRPSRTRAVDSQNPPGRRSCRRPA